MENDDNGSQICATTISHIPSSACTVTSDSNSPWTSHSVSDTKRGLPLPFQSYSHHPEIHGNANPQQISDTCFQGRTDLRAGHSEGFVPQSVPGSRIKISPQRKETLESFKGPFLSHMHKETSIQNDQDAKEQAIDKMESQLSPDGHGHFRYQELVGGDIRHQLLVQRTFNHHEDHPAPRTSSPLRKIRICSAASGTQTVTVSQSYGSLAGLRKNTDGGDTITGGHSRQHQCNLMSPHLLSPNDNAVSAHDMPTTFKTPNRNQRRNQEGYVEVTPHRTGSPFALSPASSASYGFTPGRQFVNPFEVDHDTLHMPVFSPNMFKVTSSASKGKKTEKEGFWSMEHAALIMPADIKDAEIQRQHRYQQKIDREQDVRLQSAINKFFSNEVIVPSPWSEKVKHVLPRTPGAIKSVSCQTAMSVPPGVDLLAELAGKYQLPDYQTEPSPSTDSMGNSFIRRKLLNQLNENDSEILGSPALPPRGTEEISGSPSPAKQTTPEWEKQTPNKVGSGHFSSSPIRPVPDERGHHHALSESDLLASPELSPIAGRVSKSVRTSGIFYSHQEDESPRAIMQLDFSSILDDPDEDGTDKTGTLIQRASSPSQNTDMAGISSEGLSRSTGHHVLASNASQDSEGHLHSNNSGSLFRKTLLTSALSTESTDMAAFIPHSVSNQDTGYQTASLQSTNHESASNSQDVAPFTASGHMSDFSSVPNAMTLNSATDIGSQEFTKHTDITGEFTKLRYKPQTSLDADGSFLGLASEASKVKSSSADDIATLRKDEGGPVRKLRTLSDVRLLKGKSSVSRDLTHSFNEELEKSGPDLVTGGRLSDVNYDNFTPVVNKIIGQDYSDLRQYAAGSFKSKGSSINQRFDDKETNDLFNISMTDISMRSASPILSTSLERKGMNISCNSNANILTERLSENVKTSYAEEFHTMDTVTDTETYPRFSFEDDNTLKEARALLGKSEEFRMKFETKALESDSLYQMITTDVENQNPLEPHDVLPSVKEMDLRPQTPTFKIDPVDSSTPTSRMLSSVKKRIDNVEGDKLGSEIAAEILKRAGDDLAKLTSMLGSDSSSNKS